jgi:hypothetical protein
MDYSKQAPLSILAAKYPMSPEAYARIEAEIEAHKNQASETEE